MRHYTYARPAQRDARRERVQDPRDDKRTEGSLYLELGGVVVDWRLVPYWRNVRQFKALERASGEPVLATRGGAAAVLLGVEELAVMRV